MTPELPSEYFVSHWQGERRYEERFVTRERAIELYNSLKRKSSLMERQSLEPIRLLTERWKPNYRRSLKELIKIIGD